MLESPTRGCTIATGVPRGRQALESADPARGAEWPVVASVRCLATQRVGRSPKRCRVVTHPWTSHRSSSWPRASCVTPHAPGRKSATTGALLRQGLHARAMLTPDHRACAGCRAGPHDIDRHRAQGALPVRRRGPAHAMAVKSSVQRLVMWVPWTPCVAQRSCTESEVNVILQREPVNHHLTSRKSDCSDFRKLPAGPDDETRALLCGWRARTRSAWQCVVRQSRTPSFRLHDFLLSRRNAQQALAPVAADARARDRAPAGRRASPPSPAVSWCVRRVAPSKRRTYRPVPRTGSSIRVM